jgi:murein DD-endopeptidase MepM/ murein hydrolase activator NlpD
VRDGFLEVRILSGKLLARGKIFVMSVEKAYTIYGALLGLPFETKPGEAELRLSGQLADGAFKLNRPLHIVERQFPTEDVPLDSANTTLRTAPDPKKVEEALHIQSIYAKIDAGEFIFDSPFLLPVGDAHRSAGFGDRRRYLYSSGGSDSIWHTGIDFAVPVGTSVVAPASGRVVYFGSRIVTGTTLIIEHLPRLYSVFMHLSSGLVPVGASVARGETVALSGNTGLSTGPHLHWEVRAGGEVVDPEYWVDRKPLDSEAIKQALSHDFEGR